VSDIYLWGMSRREAAEVVGLTDAQLKNFQQRYKLFPEKREGTGNPVTYDFRDMLKLAAFCQMVDDGFSAPKAAEALASYSLFGCLLHDRRTDWSAYPGAFGLTRTSAGRWAAVDGPDIASRYEIRTWVLFDRIWPKFVDAVMAADWERTSPREREVELIKFRMKMAEIRKEKWA